MKKFRFLTLLASMMFISGIHAQKTLNIDTEKWETIPSNPAITKTLTPTQKGYEVTYQFHKALVMPGLLSYITNLTNIPRMSSRKAENRIIREDRIWTYHNDFCGTMEPSQNININIRFSGTTEIKGKTYHNCYAYKAENEFLEAECPIIAYMREEGNKVYAYYQLFDNFNFENDILNQYGIDIMSNCPTTKDDFGCENCERMIFDFNLKKGETLWFNRDEIDSDLAYLYVEDVFDTEYDGNIFLTQEYTPLGTYTVYEGVGPFIGLLPYPGAVSMDYGHDVYHLQRMTDLDGKILFEYEKRADSRIIDDEYTSPIVESRYYDMQGRRMLGKPSKGVYIKIDILEDGTSKVTRNIEK